MNIFGFGILESINDLYYLCLCYILYLEDGLTFIYKAR